MYVSPQEEDYYPMDCDVLHFFELGSCHYDFYLVNIRLPVDGVKNQNIGKITDLELWVSKTRLITHIKLMGVSNCRPQLTSFIYCQHRGRERVVGLPDDSRAPTILAICFML